MVYRSRLEQKGNVKKFFSDLNRNGYILDSGTAVIDVFYPRSLGTIYIGVYNRKENIFHLISSSTSTLAYEKEIRQKARRIAAKNSIKIEQKGE